MPRRLIVLAVSAAAALATFSTSASCRRASPSTTTTTPPRPRVTACKVLTASDVSAALGATVTAPAATNDAGADALAGRSGCAWAAADESRAVLIELVRTRDMSGSVRRTGFSANARFAAARSRYPTSETIDGLGTGAIWVAESATMHVLVDGSYLTVEVAVPVPSEASRIANTLAERAAERLSARDDQAKAD